MLEVRKLIKVYDSAGAKRKVLDNVSINFRPNEFVAVLGPSGSGKTTFLNIIGGLDHYTSGDIIINEKSTKKFHDKDWDSYRNHRIGFVFQSYNLIPHQTVLQNVRLALTLSGFSKRESTKRARKALIDVGLEGHIMKRPGQLSGGQMQRVAIARALVNNPDILLADEPTGALDSETSLQIMNLLKQVAEKRLVIMVTHNPELAKTYATRIVTLKDGQITSDSNSYNGKINTDLSSSESAGKHRKTKMSFFTALSLSTRNLLTKKGRTILVALAGSIGIIGIALISAISTGFQNYIDSIENDTLTSYPLDIRRETSNALGALLGAIDDSSSHDASDGLIHERKVLSSMLGDITTNDLKSFMQYYNNHEADNAENVRLVEYSYDVEPLIYTIDAAGKLARLNPSTIFDAIVGENSLLSSYSTVSSIFVQKDIRNIKNDTELLSGRYPEEYNELLLYVPNNGQVSDLLTYSLGLHDTEQLEKAVTKIMNGEKAELDSQTLKLTYDELLNLDLRLVKNSAIYKYNSQYNVYEDMSSDLDAMMNLYDSAVKLKIVGIATSRDDLTMNGGSGVIYLPDLTKYIIDTAAQSEVVQRQLAQLKINVFSDTPFDNASGAKNLKLDDLISVDANAFRNAIHMDIDQTAIAAKTQEYMNKIASDITVDIIPAKKGFQERFVALNTDFTKYVQGKFSAGEITPEELISNEEARAELVAKFMTTQDFDTLANKYMIPRNTLADFYSSLMDGFILAGAGGVDLASYMAFPPIVEAFDKLAATATEIKMKTQILTKVGELTSYLSSSFAKSFGVDESALASAFRLNLSQEELARLINTVFSEEKSSFSSNLAKLGYQPLDEPSVLSFYFSSFEGKTNFMKFIDGYNELMREYGQDERVIEYSDATGLLISSVKVIVDAVSYVLIAFVSISLVVSSIMIGVITYISVYERTKEIGILRAIGASKRNISSIFNAETFIIGLLSGSFGVLISYALIPIINLVMHSLTGEMSLSAALPLGTAAFLIGLSIVLTLIGGLIPAGAAARKDPVEALRSE